MGTFAKWISIENLYRVPEILSPLYVKEVVVPEKIHGTSARVGCIDEVFRVGGRNEEFDLATSKDSSCFGLLGWVRSTSLSERVVALAHELGLDLIVYGEWFGAGIQKGVTYLPAGEKGFLVFGVRIGEDLASWDTVVEISAKLGLTTVPVLYRGKPDMEVFDRLRSIPSTVAYEHGVGSDSNIAEGIVIFSLPLQRLGESYLIAKHKHPNFAERQSERRDKAPRIPTEGEATANEAANAFVEEFWTASRLEHVLTYLSEQGIDVSKPTVLGPAIRGMFDDVRKEGGPEWGALSLEAQKLVGRIHPSRTKTLIEEYLRAAMVE